MKENNHNTCVVYLLNGTVRHFRIIEKFLACLKINMKHSQNIDVEACRLRPATPQYTKRLLPTAAMCMKTVKRLDSSVTKRKCQRNVEGQDGIASATVRKYLYDGYLKKDVGVCIYKRL